MRAFDFMFLFIVFTMMFCAIMLIVDLVTGYDIQMREKCIDRNYAEFENEYCIRDYHCGIISQQFNSRCSGGRR